MLNRFQKPAELKVQVTDQMAEQLLIHLREEMESLTSMLGAVREVHCALLILDDKALKTSLDAESRQLTVMTTLLTRRRQLQSDMATRLCLVPEQVNLRRLVSMTTGSLHDSIDSIVQTIDQMSAEVDRLNRQNAAMIGQSLAIARGVIERITGSTAIHESYNATGGRAQSHVGPLIQWGG